jgi:RNA polymerase sigma-70 factor (ECF subfamily)
MTTSPETDVATADFAVRVKTVEGREAATVDGLYDEHAAALWRYARRLTGDEARAQDVVQETLLRAWQHPEVADNNERSARAWLFTVARNIVIDETRTARFRRELSTPDDVGAFDGACPDEVDAAMDRLLIGDALARLTPEHREVVRRSYFQGWTTAQIAADLGIADGTVKSRLHYALRALRLVLSEMGFTP